LIEIINKQLLLQLVGYLCYWQMGFNSVFKGLMQSVTARRARFLLQSYFRQTALTGGLQHSQMTLSTVKNRREVRTMFHKRRQYL